MNNTPPKGTPEIMDDFYSDNYEVIDAIIKKENNIRKKSNRQALSQEDIGKGIIEMIDMAKLDMNIAEYDFGSKNNLVKKVKERQNNNQEKTLDGESVTLKMIKCANGFVIEFDNDEKFIFSNSNELIKIFDEKIFNKQTKKGKKNGN